MNREITFQQFMALPENIQFQVGEYIEYLFVKYSDRLSTSKDKVIAELTPELKQFLEERLADYRKYPEKVMSIHEMEDRLLTKFGYAV